MPPLDSNIEAAVEEELAITRFRPSSYSFTLVNPPNNESFTEARQDYAMTNTDLIL